MEKPSPDGCAWSAGGYCVGRFAVYQNFDLCIDEYLNDFEVRILDQHHLVATVPEEWRDYQTP
jgi:hypothetical protein